MSQKWITILKPFKSEQGFSPVIIMGLLLFLAIAIIAGSYYVKNFTNILKSQASEEVEVPVNQENLKSIKEEVASKSAAPTPPPIQKTGNDEFIYFYKAEDVTQGISGMKKFNLTTEKVEPYLKNIEGQDNVVIVALPSPSLKKMVVASIEKSKLTPEKPPSIMDINFHICLDLNCTNPQVLDKSVIASQLTFKKFWYITQWVNNSETKLILTAYPRDPVENNFQRTEIAVLDIETMEIKTLLSDYFSANSEFLLDTTLDLMIASNVKNSGDSVVSTYNLIDNKRTDFPAGKIKNFHFYDFGNSSGFGPFYIQAKSGEPETEIKNLEVYSISGNLISTFSMSNSDQNRKFSPYASWSHTNNYFAIEAVPTDIQSTLQSIIYIYAKEGTTVGSFELNLKSDSNIEYVRSIIFSSDEKKVLVTTGGQNQTIWRIFPVQQNAKMEKEIKSDKLGIPVLWN